MPDGSQQSNQVAWINNSTTPRFEGGKSSFTEWLAPSRRQIDGAVFRRKL